MGTQKRDDMLKIRGRARRCAESRRIQWPASPGQEQEASEATTDLEAARVDVLVWHTIAREVQDRPEKDGSEARSARGTGRCAGRNVKRDNHRPDGPSIRMPGQGPARPSLDGMSCETFESRHRFGPLGPGFKSLPLRFHTRLREGPLTRLSAILRGPAEKWPSG
jgi:hypothetical protein